jgi:MinD-like ATPase involved in chromosome partitioning or flagellar assembly
VATKPNSPSAKIYMEIAQQVHDTLQAKKSDEPTLKFT